MWIYSRLTNPQNELLEEAISQMEGTENTAVFGSGLAAIKAALEQFTRPAKRGEKGEYIFGEKIVVIGGVYGGTFAQMQKMGKDTGRQIQHLPLSAFLGNGLPEDTKLVFFEPCNNPTLRLIPIEKVVEEARRVGALVVADNTFTPMSIKPAELGVDIIIHSMTKYLNGQSEDLGGSVSGSAELISQLSNLHNGERMLGGGVMAPRVAKEFLQNMENLPERLYQATQNARGVLALAHEFGLKAISVESSPHFSQNRNPQIPETIADGMVALYLDSADSAHELIKTLIQKGIGKCAVSLGCQTTYRRFKIK